ncbi:MAG: bifunctional diaminohydroxyphosphoribosylaminopyrimidine deaminase/5-amino-6-(5-phosphoribosylamino)uracil reductase RibD [Microcystaceae cyanobacterium]
MNDSALMQRCLELARLAQGKTGPNPLVGAVIVKNGEIVGEGYHPKAGDSHAEVFALKDAGEEAQDATVYVNLEPCNHYGRTPPCTEALIRAKVGKVVVGMVDPNPLVAGTGIKRLEDAGIDVIVGVEEADCRQLNEAFIHRITHHLPFGILKYAMTLDGKIASTTGHSAWVTGEKARHRVHQVRAACDAVIVGGNTVRLDNPHLTTHKVSDRNPLRVILSPSFNLPSQANLWHTETANTLIFTQLNPNLVLKQQLSDQGVEIIELDNITPLTVMKCLYERGLSSVLWECGGKLAAKAITNGVIQKVMAFIAPKIIGGDNAPSPIGDLNLTEMTDAFTLKQANLQLIDQDWLIEGYL